MRRALIHLALCLFLCHHAVGQTQRLFSLLSQFDYIYPSEIEGLVLVQKKTSDEPFRTLCGLMDREGRMVLECKYNALECSVPGVLAALRDSVVYVFDRQGREIARYEGYLDDLGDEIEEMHHSVIGLRGRYNGGVGFVGTDGQLLMPCTFENIYQLSDNPFLYNAVRNDSCFVLDWQGQVLLATDRYDINGITPDGHYLANISGKRLNGVVDSRLREVVPCRYRICSYDSDADCFLVSDSAKHFGVYGTDGSVLFPCHYEGILCLTPNLFATWEEPECSYTLRDRQGRILGDGHRIPYMRPCGWLTADDGRRRTGVIDTAGRWLVEPAYNAIFLTGKKRAVATTYDTVQQKTTYYIIDRRGRRLAQYDDMQYNMGCCCNTEKAAYIAVRKGDRWGYLDSTLHEVITPRYAHAEPSHDSQLSVYLNDSTAAIVDPTGHIMIEAEGWIYRLWPGIYYIEYPDDDNNLHHYLLSTDGTTTATPGQRAAARRYTRRYIQQMLP